MESLDSLVSFWTQCMMAPSFIIGFLGVFIFIFSKSKSLNLNRLNNGRKIGIILISQLVFTWSIGFSLIAFFENRAQAELITFLNSPDLELKINGNKINDNESKKIYSEIKKIGNFPSEHPILKKELNFKIKSRTETYNLWVIQNSRSKNEFHVYSDKYKSTDIKAFGILISNLLMKYYSG